MASSGERTAVLVIRAWTEDGAAAGFRARVTTTLDISKQGSSVEAFRRPEDVVQSVLDWLAAFAGGTDSTHQVSDRSRSEP